MKAYNQKVNQEVQEITLQPVDNKNNLLSTGLSTLSNALIMMVDDESITMEIMQSYLEDAGYQNFVLLEDPTQAIQSIEHHRPDLLLLDLVMPNINGFEILELVRNHEQFSHLPVIILTSSTEAETKIKALEGGASDFLAKPVDPSELKLRVRNTIAAKAYQDQLAYYDGLTHLPNKTLFKDKLRWSIQQAERHGKKLVLLHIFFSQFKQIYDAFGQETGDNLIKQIAERINEGIRDYDLLLHDRSNKENITSLFRLGSEEFSILCIEISHPGYAATIASRIIDLMKKPFDADGKPVSILPNIGIATFPDDADEMEPLISASVSACYSVGGNQSGQFQFYSEDMNKESAERLQLETELRHAINVNEFCLFFQPKVDPYSSKIQGAEVLVRWQKPDGNIIGPNTFIPLAEETNLIVPIGEWVLREACKHLSNWQQNGIYTNLSVNVSAQQFKLSNLMDVMRSIKHSYQVDLSYLTLELTESSLMDDPKSMVQALNELIGLGIKISLDDFGTGFSSLSYLRSFPLHELKIDRSFVMDIESNKDNFQLVTAIVKLARTFNLNVVAEGIENENQLKIIQNLQCEQCQGYYFSKPVPYDIFNRMLQQHGEKAS